MIIGEFSDVFPPELDGVGAVVRAYAEELTRAGDECYYIAPYGVPAQPLACRTLLYRSVKVPREAYSFGLPGADPAFRRALDEIPFQLAHAHSPFTAGHAALHLARSRGIPLVGTFHSKYYDDFLKVTRSAPLARQLTRQVVRFYEQCDAVWAVNHATGDVLRSYGYTGEIQVMENGTNPWTPTQAERDGASARFSLTDNAPVLLFVGQINWKKNLRCVLTAAAQYAQTSPMRLVLVGQGSDESAVRALAESLGIAGRTVFTGHIADRALLRGLYARADLFLFPSLYDNAPMVVREAAASGTPSIVVRGSCAAESITDGDNGFLCADDPADLCRTIVRALPDAAAVGRRAQATIPVPWPVLIRSVRAQYRSLIDAAQKSAPKPKDSPL